MATSKLTITERIMRLTIPEPNSGCWLWTGQMRGGYGRIKIGGRRGTHKSAHVLLYEVTKGPVPEGLELDHLCRTRCCVNPDHLEAVTHAVNRQRGTQGDHLAARTHCPQGHPYDEANTMLIARRSAGVPTGGFNRMCRECCRSRRREWYKTSKR